MTEQRIPQEPVPEKGARLVDARTGREGEVMDFMHNLVYLRPPGGGREWEVRREDLRTRPSRGGRRRGDE